MNDRDLLELETDLVAAAFANARLTETITITEADFYRPALGAAWEAIRNIHGQGRIPDPPMVVEEGKKLGARLDHQDFVEMYGKGSPSNADYYAAKIIDQARRRGIRDNLVRGMQMLQDEEAETDKILSEVSSSMSITTRAEQDSEDMQTLDEFVDQPLPPEEWIVPNVLAKGDRVVITGEEGFGKSVLIRQLAVCAAAGIDPFTSQPCDPKKVLVIDAENPRRIMQRRFWELRAGMRVRNVSTGDRLWIKRYPQGFYLNETANRLTLHNLCMTVNPDVLVIGPVYKLYDDGDERREETLAKRVTSVLDGLREEFDMSLILEHHSPHASGGRSRDLRPIGSSLWRRWPEFGIGLAPADSSNKAHRVADVVHWRGGRDDRPWPEQLESGTNGLPWVVADPMSYMAESS